MSFKSERLKSRKTVTEVKTYMGVSDTCVYQWETGKTVPRPNKLIRLAQLYGCTVEDLLKEDKAS